MSKLALAHLIAGLQAGGSVSDDLLLEAVTYSECSQGRRPDCAGPAFAELLVDETITAEDLTAVKQVLVDIVVTGRCQTRQMSAIAFALSKFGDKRLVPLLTIWLDRHLRLLLEHNGAVSQLLYALEDLGAAVPPRSSSGITSTEQNLETARRYLGETLGFTYPW
ncbi:hypothetical protein [Tahibacter amnicola]|uniref:Uncharacterized protein n=1 Tax=Tahibacter amnicola TaxID=2976241 RepID=A0ABY6BK37_9GAMM|nr:hypothetical protein [Tahibacter amnicola]UXI68157.1 hypothetical protein N4264_00445 [Tahibacter amnicola]